MDKLITFGPSNQTLEMFSSVHVNTMLVIALCCIAFIFFSRRLKSERDIKMTGFILGTITLLQQVSLYVWYTFSGMWSLQITLPLQLCDISIFIAILVMFKRSRYLMELLYFWGLGGATQAILTPDIGEFTFPHFAFYQFFLSHSLIIITVIYLIVAYRFRPTFKSVIRVFVITNIYGLMMLPVNYLTGGNYLFLHEKPAGGSILDFMGPWPWYLLSLEALAIVVFLLLYLPFAIKKPEGSNPPTFSA